MEAVSYGDQLSISSKTAVHWDAVMAVLQTAVNSEHKLQVAK